MKRGQIIALTTFLLIGLILSFVNLAYAQGKKTLELPETPEGILDIVIKFIKVLPTALREALQEVLDTWGKIYSFFKEKIWPYIEMFFRKRITIFKQEWKKELQEMREDWERLKIIILERIKQIM